MLELLVFSSGSGLLIPQLYVFPPHLAKGNKNL